MSVNSADIEMTTSDDAGLFGAAATGLVIGAAEVATMALVGSVVGPIAGAIVGEAAGHVTQKIISGFSADDGEGTLTLNTLHSLNDAPLNFLEAQPLSAELLPMDTVAFDTDALCESPQSETANICLQSHESVDL